MKHLKQTAGFMVKLFAGTAFSAYVRIMFLAVLMTSGFFILPEDANALRIAKRYPKVYTLSLSVSGIYSKTWTETRSSSTFTQAYNLNFTGYAVDPRLAYFTFHGTYSDKSLSGDYDKSKVKATTVYGFDMHATLFQGINENRGLKLWKKIPRPIIIKVSYYNYDTLSVLKYGISLNYRRPGYLRFFAGKKFIYYDDGTRANANVNRYRVKYNIYNRNGNGNGNGNFNSNNNNRNNNWNNNRNNNNQNNNRNNNLNNNRNNFNIEEKKGLFGFRFPFFSFDFDRVHSNYNNTDRSIVTTTLSLRAVVANPAVKKRNGGFYRSSYSFAYRFVNSAPSNADSSTQHSVGISSAHRWKRFNLDNGFHYSNRNGDNSYALSSELNYQDTYKKASYSIPYILGLSGSYSESDGDTDYSISARASANTSKFIKLSPKLTSLTRAGVNTGRTEGSDKSGSTLYSIFVQESLTSSHFRHVRIISSLSTGYSESGVPIRFSLRGDTVGYRKFHILGEYIFSTSFPKAHRGRSMTNTLRVAGDYNIRQNLNASLGLSYSVNNVKNGETAETRTTSANGRLFWNITARQSLNVQGTFSSTNSKSSYYATALYRAGLFRRARVVAYALWRWDEESDKTEMLGRLTFGYAIGRFSIDAEYEYKETEIGSQKPHKDNRVVLRVTRTFGKAFRRLW
jgi:hypothetical protein